VVGTFKRMGTWPWSRLSDPLVRLATFITFILAGRRVSQGSGPGRRPKTRPPAFDEVLGAADARGVICEAWSGNFELPDAFPLDVGAEASACGAEVREAWRGPRPSLPARRTIDGADAKT